MRLNNVEPEYDMVIAGGGITGAGVFNQAVRMGYTVLLAEARDFAWGTSSRSSKMVHGGLRYLKQGKFLLTRSAVKEREFLLKKYPGLVTPLDFIMPIYTDSGPGIRSMKMGLSIYSLMAGKKQHTVYDREKSIQLIPGLKTKNLSSAVGFRDAQVDDARLVLRLIFDSCDMGGHALNYTRVRTIERDAGDRVCAVQLEDTETGTVREIRTRAVINATGAFAETMHPSPVKGFHIRPLRGSHLIFRKKQYDLDRVISFAHPEDQRPVFLFPWEDALVLGTTDVDFTGDLNAEPGITKPEADYLVEGLGHILPDLKLSVDTAVASIAGIRPVLSSRKKAASKESREHVVWKNKGLVTVTGGKLTTFRLLADDALKAALPFVSKKRSPRSIESLNENSRFKTPSDLIHSLSSSEYQRLNGRYGQRISLFDRHLTREGRKTIETTPTLFAELFHAASTEQVCHLSDLMLRRVRIGLQLPSGGIEQLNLIKGQLSRLLGWDSARWEKEVNDYSRLWKIAYSPAPWREQT